MIVVVDDSMKSGATHVRSCFAVGALQAQLVLLIILTIAICNFFIGTLMPVSDFKESRGFVGYSGERNISLLMKK